MTDVPPAGAAKPPGLVRGTVCWAELDPTRGREQSGRRPVLVVAGRQYLETVTTLVIVVPVTGVERGWSNHVRLHGPHGLGRPSWAMTEQPRTLSRARLVGAAGLVDAATLHAVDRRLRDFLALA
ncbi:type II toxin-antitoxin system PemK/MazF family toxin [Cellulomonas sp. PhB143]|uniref:type II toxin-antitoxin system PemK/MazF family toxin n=1 Tax=Cellulomonas sp. PhB143 TaxID=2485186 RepID=UPI000F463FDA|nr:type II toxin-antitoxin system PemK/MazF family toxin [Cellulomonas sp. PhB143]ROS79147.1 mRNA interferase MazF [Cellulomonas sp. PhB143]